MEANELRIGNLVEYLGEFKEVLGMDEETVFLKNTVSVNYLELDEISPISLTEEWLLKFGFKKYKDNYGSYYIKQSRTVKIRKNGIDRYRYEHSRLDIKYVHQLQNLYFAITETELIFKS